MKLSLFGKPVFELTRSRADPGHHISSSALESFLINGTVPGSSATGLNVSEETALKCAAVYSCVRVLSESVAQLPLKTYKRLKGKGKEPFPDHPLSKLLSLTPNPEMTAFTFWETMMAHLPTWGNAFAFIEWNGAGHPAALWPLKPNRVEVRRMENGEIGYILSTDKGQKQIYYAENILHIPGLGFDGLVGYSVIRMAAEAIGLDMAAERYAGKFFGNSATPGGVFEHPTKMSKEAQERFKEGWEQMHTGLENAHKTAVLEEGMKYKQITVNPEDAQLLESRKFSRSIISGLFRVPAHMINDLEKATFSNIEHQSIEFAKYTLTPWLRRIEQSLNTRLFTPREQDEYFAEFVLDGLLRGDVKSRNEAHEIAIRSGYVSINEVRAEENRPPVEGGDRNLVQMQMIPIDQLGQEVTNNADKNGT